MRSIEHGNCLDEATAREGGEGHGLLCLAASQCAAWWASDRQTRAESGRTARHVADPLPARCCLACLLSSALVQT